FAEFQFNPAVHDRKEKVVVGHTIAAMGGEQDAVEVIDILAHHPSTAKFISRNWLNVSLPTNHRRRWSIACQRHLQKPMETSGRCSRQCSVRPSFYRRAHGKPRSNLR